MIRMISLVAALLGALFFAAPAFAQTDEARPGGMVTLTFRLAVEGDVPGWQHFAVEYYPAGGQPGQVPLCTTAADEGMAGPRCVGGSSYTASVEVPAGNPVTVRFLRHDTRTAPEYFREATASYDTDTAVAARYEFPGAAPASEADDATGVAGQDQYTSQDGILGTHLTNTGDDDVLDLTSDATSTSTPASAESESRSATPSASASATPTASASAPASSSASASASTSSPVMEVLPDTGGMSALPALGVVLVILGVGSAFRKVL